MGRLTTDFARRLGIDVPIFGFSHSVDVTAAIARAGGMGVYGVAHDPPAAVPGKLAAIRQRQGNRPLCVDIMMPKGMPQDATLDSVRAALPEAHRAFVQSISDRYDVPPARTKSFFNSVLRTPSYFEGQLQALLASNVDVVAFGVGLTEDAVARLKQQGKIVGALIGNPRHLDAYQSVGLDFVVAQGAEAGGHTGTIGTMVLVPEIVERAGDLPVLAAGGIGHGSQIAAALAMGAQGVWLGTAWLTTKEHAIGDHAIGEKLRQKLIEAGSSDTAVTRGSSGKPQRQIRSAWTQAWSMPEAPHPLGMPYQHALVGDLLTAIDEHQIDPLLHSPAGQGVVWTRRQSTVAELIDRLTSEAEHSLERLRGLGA